MMTVREAHVYKFLKKYNQKNGFAPTVREIASATDIPSTSSVLLQLDSLEKKGYIRRNKMRPRSISILSPSRNGRKTREEHLMPGCGTVTSLKLFWYIHGYNKKFGHPPTISRLEATGINISPMDTILDLYRLEDDGWIKLDVEADKVEIAVPCSEKTDINKLIPLEIITE